MRVERIHRPQVVEMNDEDKMEMCTPGLGWVIFAESESESRELWDFITQFYDDEPENMGGQDD